MVTFRFDVFNILNSHAIEDRDEIGDLDETGLLDPSYHQARLYQAPRSVRLGIDVNF
jgi:hypothetical protein